jgi:hypothetical protein
MGFFYASCEPAHTSLSEKKTRSKLRDQRHEQVLPPCESMQGNKYERSNQVPMGGGEVIDKILAKTAFSFWGFVFESAGSSHKKKEADSKTANLILGETKG